MGLSVGELRVILPDISPVVLGTRIRDARLLSGLTQQELTAGMVTSAFISRIEAGDRRPSAELLMAMATRLRVDVEVLVAGVGFDGPEDALVHRRALAADRLARAVDSWLEDPVDKGAFSLVVDCRIRWRETQRDEGSGPG